MGWEIILSPFALLYKLGTAFRNHLYDIGSRKSFRFEVFTIGIGNLTVGGTGKTPMTEYLIRLLKDRFSLVSLSRGYGRKTRGFILASDEDDAGTIGDEPYQLYNRFSQDINVSVGEERALAIPEILHSLPETDLILLDDVFQHRSVDPHLNILLCDYNRPFFKDHLLPMGRLRESRAGAERADLIVVTKCPSDFGTEQQQVFTDNIKKYSGKDTEIYFSRINYGKLEAVSKGDNIEVNNVFLISGIASPEVFEGYLQSRFNVVEHFRFRDHHDYSDSDLKRVSEAVSRWSGKADIITTEKDVVKLKSFDLNTYFKDSRLFYLPIEFEFVHSGEKFDKSLTDLVMEHNRSLKN